MFVKIHSQLMRYNFFVSDSYLYFVFLIHFHVSWEGQTFLGKHHNEVMNYRLVAICTSCLVQDNIISVEGL